MMTTATIRGHAIEIIPVRDSFSRRATLFKNKILIAFKNAGVSPEQVNIPDERAPMRKMAAEVTWYALGFHCHYSYARGSNYAENLYLIMRLLEIELQTVADGKKTMETFVKDFNEDDDVREKRREARKTLGVDEDCMDTEIIDVQYRKLAKNAHPDMPTGSTEVFKKINNAHKMLKRELE